MKTMLSLSGAIAFAFMTWVVPIEAAAQECSTGLCGTPDQSGGGCGCGCSVLVAQTDTGDTYQFADDFDNDGIEDEFDNCPFRANFEQVDSDGDGFGDNCDVCAATFNPDQKNMDGDEFGDLCDADADGDTIVDLDDNCPLSRNFGQLDTNGDGEGDVCDDDDDGDGTLDIDDTCRLGVEGVDACEDDEDDDGVNGGFDNCPSVFNPPVNGLQPDIDGDGAGDLCDNDMDADGIENYIDNCPGTWNQGQVDVDRDGIGDAGNFGAGAPESCDQVECYVVMDGTSCLDPDSAFDIELALVVDDDDIRVGEDINVAIFSNRLNLAHSWTATISEMPRNAIASLINAEGSGSTQGFPQVINCIETDGDGGCVRMNQISFSPDAPGTYTIEVTTMLAGGEDPEGLGTATSVATITAEVAGDASSGCSASQPGGFAALFAMAALGLVRRRRR